MCVCVCLFVCVCVCERAPGPELEQVLVEHLDLLATVLGQAAVVRSQHCGLKGRIEHLGWANAHTHTHTHDATALMHSAHMEDGQSARDMQGAEVPTHGSACDMACSGTVGMC